MIWHIFYTASTGEISWSTSGDVNQDIKDNQKRTDNLDYLEVNMDDMPDPQLYYINNNDVEEKQTFNPTFSSDVWDLDATINVTGLPVGTEVILDGSSQGTMTNTTLTLTISETGRYILEFRKVDYKKYVIQKMVRKAT